MKNTKCSNCYREVSDGSDFCYREECIYKMLAMSMYVQGARDYGVPNEDEKKFGKIYLCTKGMGVDYQN